MPSRRNPPDDRPPRPTPAARRHAIVVAARAVFRSRGYDDATPEAVAAVAKMKPSTVAKLFPHRAALFAAVYDEFHSAAFVPPEGGPASDGMPFWLTLADRFEKAAKAHRDAVGLVLKGLAGHGGEELAAAAADALRRSAAGLGGLIRAGQAGGVVRRTLDPERAAWEWVRWLFGGLLVRSAAPPPPPADDDLPPQPADVLLHGLLKTDV